MTQRAGPRVDRRTTLKWMAAALSAQSLAGCGGPASIDADVAAALGRALDVEGKGYGQDPDLFEALVPWRRTMTEGQLRLAESLADIFIPADGVSAAANVANAADFIDEWVSAPYPTQIADRALILQGLEDIEKRARRRFKAPFIDLETSQKTTLVDDLAPTFGFLPAYLDTNSFFSRFRYLVVSAFYLSDEGARDLGYIGNQPIIGPYPGPTEEALAHLQTVLDGLGLKMPKPSIDRTVSDN